MADVDHPKVHIENQEDADLPRKQPESPHHEGIDPLTEGDTMYPSEDTKKDSTRQTKKDLGTPYEETNPYPLEANDAPAGNDVGSDQDRDEPAKVTQQTTKAKVADGKVQPQTAQPAKTNDSDVAQGSTAPKESK